MESAITTNDAEVPVWLSTLPSVAYDEIFALNDAFKHDKNPLKVNLGIGVYRDNDGQPWPLPSITAAEKKLASASSSSRHEYLQIDGDPEFLSAARDLLFGRAREDSSVVSVQAISGTGANHIGAMFLSSHLKPSRVWLPDPTWPNHHGIWDAAGVPRAQYPYFDPVRRAFDFESAMTVLASEACAGDVVLLQACAHNPTGQDPSRDQWRAIAELCHQKRLFPFFDCAYQGFATGDPDEDAWAVRYFRSRYPHMPMMVAQSFSKNFGLYGQRAGALHFCSGPTPADVQTRILRNLCHIVRAEFSMAPRFGSTLVETVMSDDRLKAQWLADLRQMSGRIRNMRLALHAELVRLCTPGNWEHVIRQVGMFSYLGITESEVLEMRGRDGIYLPLSGRISLAGLSSTNVAHVAQAIDSAVRPKEERHRL